MSRPSETEQLNDVLSSILKSAAASETPEALTYVLIRALCAIAQQLGRIAENIEYK